MNIMKKSIVCICLLGIANQSSGMHVSKLVKKLTIQKIGSFFTMSKRKHCYPIEKPLVNKILNLYTKDMHTQQPIESYHGEQQVYEWFKRIRIEEKLEVLTHLWFAFYTAIDENMNLFYLLTRLKYIVYPQLQALYKDELLQEKNID